MRPASLERRTLLVLAAVVTIAVVVAALVSIGLVRSATRGESRAALRTQADLVVAVLEAGRPADINPALRVVRQQSTPAAWRAPNGRMLGDPVARGSFTAMGAAAKEQPGSHTVQLRGRTMLVETRDLSGGRLVILARPVSATLGTATLRRYLLALAIGLAVAVVAAVFFARRLTAPLRRTAVAARDLAAGARSVRVEPSGPREVAEVGESINALAEALERSEGRQREFLLSVSHELRTPLTAIRGFGESLADGVTSGDQVPSTGATLVAEARRMERLVSDLLDLARLGADDFRYDLVPVDLVELMTAAGRVWSDRCARVGVRFELDVPDMPVTVLADAARTRQILDNLAENALRVTPQGAPLVLALRVEGDRAVLEVRDGGPGLSEDDLAVAFERSVLHDRYRGLRTVGTGLGLALVRALAVGQGGSVRAGPASREGGAQFQALLPLPAADAGPPPPAPPDGQPAVAQPPVGIQ